MKVKMRAYLLLLVYVCGAVSALFAEGEPAAVSCKHQPVTTEPFEERSCQSNHTLNIQGRSLPYTATAGNFIIRNSQEQPQASIFYTSYHAAQQDGETGRPVTFCFNGGPGSASLWLHIGAFGPKRILLPDASAMPPPYGYIDNIYTLLDVTDLVFIDPVSTGYSRPASGVDAQFFHSVQEDIRSLSSFIRLYVTRYGLWDRPKFLLGESYGTFRAASLAAHLHDMQFLYLNGVILISTVLDFGTLRDPTGCNDLPYILFLPSFTATAHYHNRLSPDLQKDKKAALAAAEELAYGRYSLALLRGDTLPVAEKRHIAVDLAKLTGLDAEDIFRQQLRISCNFFVKELLKSEQKIVGRWDSRYLGYEVRPRSDSLLGIYDPSAEALLGPFTAAFNAYLRQFLGWNSDMAYVPLADIEWNFAPYVNQFAAVSDKLRSTLTKNPNLHVFVGSGYYDLATPYFATHHTLHHLGLNPALTPHIEEHRYEAGHMMYLHEPSLAELKRDLASFYKRATEKDKDLRDLRKE